MEFYVLLMQHCIIQQYYKKYIQYLICVSYVKQVIIKSKYSYFDVQFVVSHFINLKVFNFNNH
jgi:hypothetical protein